MNVENPKTKKPIIAWLLAIAGGFLLAMLSNFTGFIFHTTFSDVFMVCQFTLIAIAMIAGIALIKKYDKKTIGRLLISFAVSGILIWVYLIFMLLYFIDFIFD